jgi:hypothetical protein
MLMLYILNRDIDKPAFRRRLKTLHNPKLSKNAMSLANSADTLLLSARCATSRKRS